MIVARGALKAFLIGVGMGLGSCTDYAPAPVSQQNPYKGDASADLRRVYFMLPIPGRETQLNAPYFSQGYEPYTVTLGAPLKGRVYIKKEEVNSASLYYILPDTIRAHGTGYVPYDSITYSVSWDSAGISKRREGVHVIQLYL